LEGSTTHLSEPVTFSGAVLAGGRSSRFGQNKASFRYRGKPLALWALESLEGASERFLVANRPYDFGVPVYPDLYPGSSLGGLHAALSRAQYDWLALAACDMPFLNAAYWQKLLAQTNRVEGVQAVVVLGPEGRPQPLAALYHKSLLPLTETRLKAKKLKMQALLTEARVLTLPFHELGLEEQTFFNANYLSDLP